MPGSLQLVSKTSKVVKTIHGIAKVQLRGLTADSNEVTYVES